MKDIELTLLSVGQIFGNDKESQLEVMRESVLAKKAEVTDLCILTGCSYVQIQDYYHAYYIDCGMLRQRTCSYWTRTFDEDDHRVYEVDENGKLHSIDTYWSHNAIRPVLQSSAIFSQLLPKMEWQGAFAAEVVSFGSYPQYAVDSRMQKVLEGELISGMNKTGGSYTFNSVSSSDMKFTPITYDEYEFEEHKYIRVRASSLCNNRFLLTTNGYDCGDYYNSYDHVWVEVDPVIWYVDYETESLILPKGLVSGIRFFDKITDEMDDYRADFSQTEVKQYMDKYMLHDLLQHEKLTCIEDKKPKKIESINLLESNCSAYFTSDNNSINMVIEQESYNIPSENKVYCKSLTR